MTFISFFFNDPATTEIYTLSLHDALPISQLSSDWYWEQDAEFRFTTFTGGDRAAKWGDDQDEQVGKRRWELAGITPLGAYWEAHRALLEAHQPFRDFEYMRAASDGSVRYVSA